MLAQPLVVREIGCGRWLPEQRMAHVMSAMRLYPSLAAARRAGWDIPIAPGEYLVPERRVVVRVLDADQTKVRAAEWMREVGLERFALA